MRTVCSPARRRRRRLERPVVPLRRQRAAAPSTHPARSRARLPAPSPPPGRWGGRPLPPPTQAAAPAAHACPPASRRWPCPTASAAGAGAAAAAAAAGRAAGPPPGPPSPPPAPRAAAGAGGGAGRPGTTLHQASRAAPATPALGGMAPGGGRRRSTAGATPCARSSRGGGRPCCPAPAWGLRAVAVGPGRRGSGWRGLLRRSRPCGGRPWPGRRPRRRWRRRTFFIHARVSISQGKLLRQNRGNGGTVKEEVCVRDFPPSTPSFFTPTLSSVCILFTRPRAMHALTKRPGVGLVPTRPAARLAAAGPGAARPPRRCPCPPARRGLPGATPLSLCLAALPSPAPGSRGPEDAMPVTPSPIPSPSQPGWRWPRPALAALALVAGIALASLLAPAPAAAWPWSGPPPPPPPPPGMLDGVAGAAKGKKKERWGEA